MSQVINTKKKFLSYPAVDKLDDLKRIIKSMEFVAIPYSYLDKRNLEKLLSNGNLSNQVYDQIREWKYQHGIKDTQGYLSDIISLLKNLGIVQNRNIEEFEFAIALGGDGLPLGEFIKSISVKTTELTTIGHKLSDLLSKGDPSSLKEYDATLFWLFIRNYIYKPLWQWLMERQEVFTSVNIEVILRKIENDTYNISRIVRWSDYFDLYGLNLNNPKLKILDRKKILARIFYATILELNESFLTKDDIAVGISVEEIVNYLSKRFKIDTTYVNFYKILEVIFKKNSSKSITATTSSRGGKSLPNYESINMLRIRGKIPLFPDFNELPESTIVSFSKIWGT